jgi:hypothetical protein
MHLHMPADRALGVLHMCKVGTTVQAGLMRQSITSRDDVNA